MNPLDVGLMYGALAGCSEIFLLGLQRLLRAQPGNPPRIPRGARWMVYAVFMAGGSRFAQPRIEEWRAMNEFDKWMQSDSSYAVIAQRHPDMIATARLAVTEGFRKSLRQGDNSPAFDASRDAFKTLTATLFKRYAPSMPDEELVNFWRTWFQGIKRVAQGDSSAILATLAGGVGIPADTTANREVGQAGLRGIAAAIRSPAGVSDSVAVEATRAALIARLRTRFGDDVQMLADPLNPAFDRSRSQAVVLTFWDELFALPDHQAGPFIRQFAPMSSLP